MQFIDFIEHIKYGECYNLAVGAALREGTQSEQEVAKHQVRAHAREGLMTLAEAYNIYVGTQAFHIAEHYTQVRITDPNFLRVMEVASEGKPLRPFSVQNTSTWDYQTVSHGLLSFRPEWAGKVVQVLFKQTLSGPLTDDTVIPAPFIHALSTFVALRLSGAVGGMSEGQWRQSSVQYARYSDALDQLTLAGYASISETPAKNVQAKGYV